MIVIKIPKGFPLYKSKNRKGMFSLFMSNAFPQAVQFNKLLTLCTGKACLNSSDGVICKRKTQIYIKLTKQVKHNLTNSAPRDVQNTVSLIKKKIPLIKECGLLSKKKIIALDFDGTLVKSQSKDGGVGAIYSPSRYAFSNQIVQLEQLVQQSDALVYVVTYNTKDNVSNYLESYPFLKSRVLEILTPVDFGVSYGTDLFTQLDGKNVMLNYIKIVHNIIDNRDIILVDDSKPNIQKAKSQKFSTTISKDISNGISRNNISSIKKFLTN